MHFTIDRYWGLMGEGENADEFMLIARLCDEVIINYEGEDIGARIEKVSGVLMDVSFLCDRI